MKNKHYTLGKLFLLIFICLITLSSTWAQEPKQTLAQKEKTTKNALNEGSNCLPPELGIPFIINKTGKSFIIEFSQASGIKKENFFTLLQDSLGKNTHGDHKWLNTSNNKEYNLTTHRYQQFYKNIPVEYSLINLHLKGSTLETATGIYYPGLQVNTSPTLTPANAIQAAIASVKSGNFNWLNPDMEQFIKKETGKNKATYYPTAELIISRDYSLPATPDNFRLCYKIKINTYMPRQALEVYVDAHTGQIISSNDIIAHCATSAPHEEADHKHFSKLISGNIPTAARSVISGNTDATVPVPSIGSGNTLFYGMQSFPTETDPVTNAFRLESGPERQNYIVRNMLLKRYQHQATDFVRVLKPGSTNSNWTSNTAKLSTLRFRFTKMLDCIQDQLLDNLGFKNCHIKIQDRSNTIIFKDLIVNFQLNKEYQINIDPPLPLLLGSDYVITFYDENLSTPDSQIAKVYLEARAGTVVFSLDTNNNNDGTGSIEATAGISGALDVAFGINKSLDYFRDVHGRTGFNNLNGRITAYIHPNPKIESMDNASFDPTIGELFLGEGSNDAVGPLCSLDVIGHEVTHGVIATSARLVHKKGLESTALNESFADIFGTAIEFNTLSAGIPNWLIGDRPYSGTGYLRSMSNPKAKGQPDFYKGDNWDFGPAIHHNAGVQNRWFYLLCEGGSGTNDAGDEYDVQGIGMEKAMKIVYLNLTKYLFPESVYINAFAGSLVAAKSLYGRDSQEYKSVVDAWYAVGLPSKMKITRFTPRIGIAAEGKVKGTIVTITGENFAGVTDVMFNFTLVKESNFIINKDYTQIKVMVPEGATTGKITLIAGKYKEQTTTDFYVGKPTINSFSPTAGFASTDSTSGTLVNIIGENFIDITAVYFGETLVEPSEFKVKSDGTRILVNVPKSAITGRIKVVRDQDAFGVSKDFFIVKKTTITSLAPAEGKLLSTVKIIGENFENIREVKVKFNGTPSTGFSVNDEGTEISAEVPIGATTGPVTVVTRNQEAVSPGPFTVNKLTLNDFALVYLKVGDVHTIYGQHFQDVHTVSFNGVPVTHFTINDDFTQIRTTVPQDATTGLLCVKDLTDTVCSEEVVNIGEPPTITAINPTRGAISTPVTITGTNLASDFTYVKFTGTDDQPAIVVPATDTSLTVTVPEGAKTGPITVYTPFGQASSVAFTVVTKPTITSFLPSAGFATSTKKEGTPVEIIGTYLGEVTEVFIGNIPVPNFRIVDDTKIIAIVPTDAITGKIILKSN